MTLAATSTSGHDIVPPVVLIVFMIGGIIYVFGYLRAVMHRANKDYKATKAAVPVLRKGFWLAWWSAVKIGFWVFIAGFILVVWMVRDNPKDADATTEPTPSVSASHPRR